MQRVREASVGHGEPSRTQRLCGDLAAVQHRPWSGIGGVETAEEVAVEALDVEHRREIARELEGFLGRHGVRPYVERRPAAIASASVAGE